MNISSKKRNLIMWGYLLPALTGLGAIVTQADAQNAAQPEVSNSGSIAASTMRRAVQPGDEDLGNRVQTALHADPYFYDKHVTVSVEKGSVVLRGFVFSGWELQDAVRIARKAAGNARVIDDLSIQLGGR
jgi:osmotically-inducible protein OsmY